MYSLLLVDDERLELQMLAHHVDWHAMGFQVAATAANGRDALDLLRQLAPDAILTDIKMPIMDGIDFARRAREAGCRAQIAFLSGFAEFTYAQSALSIGACGYLIKPIDMEELQSLMGTIKLRLERERPVPADAPGDAATNPVELVKRVIHEQYGKPLTIDALAERAYLSPNYLSSVFKDATGKTILEYLTDTRMDAAKALLRGSRLRIRQISECVGYENPSHFCQVFQRKFGTTPNQFRISSGNK